MEASPVKPRCTRDGLDTVTMFGMTINNVTLEEVFASVSRQIEAREPGYILTPNVDHVCIFQHSEPLRNAYHKGFLVLTDGVPIIWASKLLGKPVRQKISGSDLVYWLAEYAAEKGYSIFFFGAEDGIAQRASEVLSERYPGLRVAGVYSPPMGFYKDPELAEESVRIVRESGADICYVALGAPLQDLWNYENHQETGIPVHIGIGASLDFIAGKVKRAPLWMQKSGLEWTWRTATEPRRLAKRYMQDILQFFPLLAKEFFRSRR
jgi:N-acetylglucosaminyldiphosphoundecaprenol N-acetyl-beta-D-mannosaminyltransferase